MRKKTLGLLVVAVMAVCSMGGCGSAKVADEEVNAANVNTATDTSELQTYEFETFDGTTVVIDDSNIISQEACDEPLEWADLPSDAEQIAPGRDYVLFETDSTYYVEDAANSLVTIATKPIEEEITDPSETFSNETFKFDYYPSAFYVREEEGSVIASFVSDSVETAGANIVELKVLKDTSLDAAVKEYQEANNIKDEDVSDVQPFVTNNADSVTVTFGDTSSEGSELTTQTTAFFVENGGDVVYIEVFRHIDPDENTEMYINDMIAVIFDTLEF